MTATSGEKDIATRYPITDGIIAGTTKQKGRQSNLVPEQGSLVSRKMRIGL